MSLLQASFASDTESDDEEFEDTAKVDSSDSEDEAQDEDSSSSSSNSRAAGKDAAAAAAEAEVEARGGRKKRKLELKRSKKKEKRREEAKQRAAADALYEELRQQHMESVKKYPAAVAADDFLLRFHKREAPVKLPATASSVLGALRVHCSKVQPSSAAAAAAAAAAAVAVAAKGDAQAAAAAAELAAGQTQAAATPPTAAAAAAHAAATPVAASAAATAVTAAAGDAAAVAAAAAAASYRPAEHLDIAELKKRCRLAPTEALKELIRNAVQEGAATSEKTISKTVRFAGREFQIEERVSADQYAAYEKAEQKKVQVRGDLQALDALDKALTNATAINSVQKSRADWFVCCMQPSALRLTAHAQAEHLKLKRTQFKEKAGIEEELRRGKGYLERQAFLADTTWKIHQQNVELRRQQQQQRQLQQQLQQPQRPAGP